MKFQFAENLRSGLFWIGLFKLVGQLFVWANTIIIAHFLNPADYGLVGMANLITTFILLIGDFGFGTSIVQRKDLQPIHVHSLFWITTSTGLFFVIALYWGAPFYASIFSNPEVMPILQLSVVALFFNIISDIPIKLLLKDLQYKSAGIIDFTSNLIASISVLTFAINGFGAYSLVLGTIITGILKFSLACRLGRWFPEAKFQKEGLQGFFRFGGAIIIDRILWYIYSNADYMILAKKLGQVLFGFYSFAYNFASIPTSKLQPIIYPVLFSSFSKIQDDLPQLREQFLKIVGFAFAFYAMIYCGIFWVSPEFVKIFLGAKWEPIIPVLQILLLIQPLRAVSTLSPSLIDALGKPSVGAKNMAIFVAIMVPSFFFASHWGMLAVALTWCSVYPLVFFITVSRILRVAGIPLRKYLAEFLPGVKFFLLTSLVIFAYKTLLAAIQISHPVAVLWINFGGTILLGALSNFAILWWSEKKYLNMLRTLIKK